MIRLQKFLADAGVASRRKAEELMAEGKIKVNGKVVRVLGMKVDPENDEVEYDKKIVKIQSKKIYLALNKPVGYVSSATSVQGQSVLELIKISDKRLYPVGRLDKDSSGLLLITNDGDFALKQTHPRYGLEKEYFAILDQDLRSEHIKILEKGMRLMGKKLHPVKVIAARNKSAQLVLQEGVNRQIRRMLGKLGYTVIRLKRVRIGKLELGDLKEGQYKEIHPKDI